jgi:NAD(P)-dependent dehydrogenase (short-subunit alcohol dehydrogenase family)
MLSGKVIAVTGAGKGIGKACVTFFLEHGASVVALTRSVEDVRALNDAFAHNPFEALAGDVTHRVDLERLLERATVRFGRADGLVNNAGIRQRKEFLSLSREEFDQVLRSNLTSCFEAMQVFAPSMIANGGGSIVNIASIVGPRGFAQLPGYAAAKAGLIGLSQSVAVELAERGVRINVIAPGFIATSYADAFRANQPKLFQWTLDHTPMKRWGQPEEVASCAAYLLSNLAGYVTGAVYPVDGGWLAA